MSNAVESFDPMAAIAPRPAPRTSSRDDAEASSFADHMRNEVSRSDAANERRDTQIASNADKADASAQTETPGDAPHDDEPALAEATDDQAPAPPPEKSEHAAAQQNCAYLIQSLADEAAAQAGKAETAKPDKANADASAQNPDEITAAQDDVAQALFLKEASHADAACDAPASIRTASPATIEMQDSPDDSETADATGEPQPNLAALTPQPAPHAQPVVAAKPKADTTGAIDADAARTPAPTAAPRQAQDANAAPDGQGETPAPNAAQAASDQGSKPERAEARADAPAPAAQNQAQAANTTASTQTNAAQNLNPAFAPAPATLDPLQAATTPQNLAAEAARTLPPHAQVGREIVRRFDGENAKFEIRLDPPELGRVEIKLEMTRDHRVNAIVSADNPQALADLARSARDLTSALQSAGLELNENGLSFDLSQKQSQNSDQQAERQNTPRTAAAELESVPQPAQRLHLESWRGGRIDLVA